MDAQIQNQSSKALADSIKATLADPPYQFELQDPFMDTTYGFKTSDEAMAKSEEFGANRFQGIQPDGKRYQIIKTDDEWANSEGKLLAEIQDNIDQARVAAIEGRAELRATAGSSIDAETDKQMAQADVRDILRIQHSDWQGIAAVQMAENARANADYMAGLSSMAKTIAALDAANTEKILAKEIRKSAEMALNARANPAYKAALKKAAPDVAQVVTGVSMKSMPGKLMVYNDQPGIAGAEIIDEDGSRISFGGKTAIDLFAEEYKLAPEDVQTLKEMDTRADEFRTPAPVTLMSLDPAALERVAVNRARENAQVREALGHNAQNTIEPGEEATRSAPQKKSDVAKPAQPISNTLGNRIESDEILTASQKPIVPPDIEKQYLRVGDKFYHPMNTDLVAFEDKGNKLETKSDSENIAKSLVRIAEARGWDEIKVSGSETFRKEVWLAAASRGMHVKGYTPTDQDKAALAKQVNELVANKIENASPHFRGRENEGEPAAAKTEAQVDMAGELVAHGPAKYMHDEKNTGSYYVTTRDAKGNEKTSWGVDLERAVTESGAKVGDSVLVTNEGYKHVTVTVPVRDHGGKIIGSEQKETRRNSWNVQMAETFAKETPAEAVKKHPELAGAAAALAVMEKQAEADGLTPAQRAIVAARVRQNIVNSIERGELPEVKIKETVELNREATTEAEYTR